MGDQKDKITAALARDRKMLAKQDQKTLIEARTAIRNLEATLNQGQNRYGSYGQNCRDSIKWWEATIARIEASSSAK